MGDVTFDTVAYSKIVLHAVKYPHCAVNGVLLADATNIKEGSRNQDLEIVDAVPLFHHSHYVSPMAEIALTQIDVTAQANNRVIVGYYAACENYRDNTVEKCPGQKIVERITEYFPSAVFAVVDNTVIMTCPNKLALKLYRHSEGKWKLKDLGNKLPFQSPHTLTTAAELIDSKTARDLVDFDNYLDDHTQDWANIGIEKVIACILASQGFD